MSSESAKEAGIDIQVQKDGGVDCQRISARIPTNLVFVELGERHFTSVSYRKIETKGKGWQLMPQGTEIQVATTRVNETTDIGTLCLSKEDFVSAYLSILYVGKQGTPPMVVLLKLSEYEQH
ncbi:hypothetical protein GCM10008090_01010 [Arenicella chitinivorans]|uniref:Uncharacterized protein n=2 Tax=Arenicella chitinivorans TaxID=1329800 RepID=A0A918REA7_9GAMM|nr:hypothetical protein GCM10008090_01010 [Arenicella chitinivorans]